MNRKNSWLIIIDPQWIMLSNDNGCFLAIEGEIGRKTFKTFCLEKKMNSRQFKTKRTTVCLLIIFWLFIHLTIANELYFQKKTIKLIFFLFEFLSWISWKKKARFIFRFCGAQPERKIKIKIKIKKLDVHWVRVLEAYTALIAYSIPVDASQCWAHIQQDAAI